MTANIPEKFVRRSNFFNIKHANKVLTIFNRRRLVMDYLFTLFCIITTVMTCLLFALILYSLLHEGLTRFNWIMLTTPMEPPLQKGGLSNAIIGSLLMSGLAITLALPIGILIATYLVEFSDNSLFSRAVRFANDVLLSTPSIIIGLFVYALCVKPLGHYSGFAGMIALCFIALMMIVRGTEDVLYLVSPLLRESALALGISRWRVTIWIVYRSVSHGIITCALLALSRIMGETAPLLFTALSNQYPSWNLFQPMANLPVVIFRYALSPYTDWQQLAWSGALFITILILALNIFLRIVFKKSNGSR